ncbi:unnamed protein product [Rotaria sordida]|uniref:Uncharacterized protein n=1 Tax=Rotaria sordida TaxID=392033 RepID=A0A818Y741_9BILA|nr:unnamed protein product [Rotaria sordida]CAF3747035.1 unnamed protein product [Rotaria sordida]
MQTEANSPTLLDSLKCPITHELFRDPVIGSDGHTYERKNITAWVQKHAASPITRESMALNSLRPNYIVKKMVDEFLSLSSQKNYHFRLDIDVCKTKQRPMFQSPSKTIYEAKWMLKHGPPIVLIKIDGARAKCEASFYVQLSCHPHIVRTYGLVDNDLPNSIMLVQEYAPEGDLRQLLRSDNFQPTFEVLLEIFWQIVDAMICLADNQIVHGDLACRNVLVFRSSSNQSTEILVKLTDFGLTRASPLFSVFESSTSSTMTMIPVRYAAPEILYDISSACYSEKSDVYSFGVLMWETCSGGAIPYGDLKTTDNVYQERLKGKLLERPCMCSNELWNIIENCTQQESNKRPNFKAIQEDLLRLRFQNKRESFNKISFVQVRDKTAAAKLPPLEITSCPNCENMIPLNMFHIHQVPSQQPSTESYGTFNYLKPVPLPYSQTQENFYENMARRNEQTRNPTSTIDTQSEVSNRSSTQHEPMAVQSIKARKSGLRKVLSKFKRKSSP